MTATSSGGDRAGLGRGPLTRWLPVLWQAPARPPAAVPFPVGAATTPAGFTRRVVLSCRRLTVPAAVFAIAHQVGEALVPVVMGLAIDRALETGDPVQLIAWLLVLGLVFLGLALSARFAAQLTALAAQLVQHRLRSTLSTSVLHRPDRTVRESDGAILSTTTTDVTRLATGVGLGVHPVGELAGIAFVAVALVMIHWPLGLAVALGAPVVVWLMGALSGPFSRSRRTYQALLAKTVGRATDLVAGYRVVKGVRAEDEAAERYRRASREALAGAERNIGSLGVYLAGSNTISGVFVAGVAGLAGFFALNGQITIGELIAAAGLTQALIPPLTMLTANAGAAWAGALASGGRVLDLLTEATPAPASSSSSPDRAHPAPVATLAPVPTVELCVPEHELVRIEPGEMVGLRTDDRTAAGIAGALLDPYAARDAGRVTAVQVTVDGVAARQVDRAAYRSRVVVSPHVATLFSGTIAENVDLPDGPPDLRAAAVRAAACDDFVAAAPDGIDSQVGENGNRLSGGQRQRVALARALASDAAVLVLHDPTTAVDSVTEAAIADRLRDVRNGRSTVVIASSPTLLGACDRVVELHPTGDRDRTEVTAP